MGKREEIDDGIETFLRNPHVDRSKYPRLDCCVKAADKLLFDLLQEARRRRTRYLPKP